MSVETLSKPAIKKSSRLGDKPKAGEKEIEKSFSKSYNQVKQFEGHQYTGMKVGRSHKWFYDRGEWRQTKITHDLWEISFAVTKGRAGKAPEDSGVLYRDRISLVYSC